jgi:hypothetical protein
MTRAKSRRPICVYCGAPYGTRITDEAYMVVEIGKPIPPYRGNMQVVRETITPPLPPDGPATPEQALTFTPMDASALRHGGASAYSGRKGRTVRRVLWDGKSYDTPYDPFCTAACAYRFAREAYACGLRPKRKPA